MGDNGENTLKSREAVGKRLTAFYESINLSRSEFATMMGLKYETVRSYEKGRAEPGSVFFRKLKDLYPSADVGWLLTGQETFDKPSDALHVRRAPVVQTIPAGGFVAGIPDEEVIDYIYTTELSKVGLFGLKVRGKSMEPEICEGDYALLAPDMEFVNGYVYAVVAHDSEATLKKVFRTKGGWTLIPVNNDFETIFVPEDKMIRLYRLMEVIRKYNTKPQTT